MKVAFVNKVPFGEAEPGRIVSTWVDRGTGPDEVISGEGFGETSAAELRVAFLGMWLSWPNWKEPQYPDRPVEVVKNSDAGTFCHIDGDHRYRYCVERREDGTYAVTRWRGLGAVTRESLLRQTGFDVGRCTRQAATDRVAAGMGWTPDLPGSVVTTRDEVVADEGEHLRLKFAVPQTSGDGWRDEYVRVFSVRHIGWLPALDGAESV